MTERTALGDIALMAWRHGRLAPDEGAGFEARLAADPAAQALLAEWDRQDAALAAALAPEKAQPMTARMQALLAEARRVEAKTALRPVARPRGGLQVAAALALLALGAAGGWGAAHMMRPMPTTEPPMLAALRAHDTFAEDVAHPVEVGAYRMAHLTAWLSQRLGQPLTAPDLGAFGFRPIGGRILPGASGTAALLMYEDDTGQRLTLYAAPKPEPLPEGDPKAFRFVEAAETQGAWWVDAALAYAVVGAIPSEALRGIAIAAREQLN